MSKSRNSKARHSAADPAVRAVKRKWRDYRTTSGRRPVKEFIAKLSDDDAASVAAAMQEVRAGGLEKLDISKPSELPGR